MSRFKSLIPRSKKSGDLARIFVMGSSDQSQNVGVDEACRRDFESLDQLCRLHRPEFARAQLQAGELDIAAQIPILDPKSHDDFDHLTAIGPAADSDDDWADVSRVEYYDDADFYDEADNQDVYYDSLHRHSPALMNPSYFDAVRTSPSQGFGFGSSRYLESSHSSNILSLDDFQFEDDSFGDIPRQTGGFGLSGLERSPSHSVLGECLSFGAGRHYNRDDPPVQILNISMPDPDVLEALARAPPREGKNSPFRSYYCYEPALTDIDEETEPESDSGPTVVPTPLKHRHEKRSRSESIAKMLSSPFTRSPPYSQGGLQSPHPHRKDWPASNGSKITSSSAYRSARGTLGESSPLGGGTLSQIDKDDKEHENADASKTQSPFVCMKTPAPFVADQLWVGGSVPYPLPYDGPEGGRQPLAIAPEERIRLLDEPSFIGTGVIPKEYVQFEKPEQENPRRSTPKPSTPQPKFPKAEPETPKPDNSQPDYSDSEESQPDPSLPQKPFPVRGSSLNATPRSNATYLSPGCSYNASPLQGITSPPPDSSLNAAVVYDSPEAMSSYDALESKVTGVSAYGAANQRSLDLFSHLLKAASCEPVDGGAVQQADKTSARANEILANIHGFTTTPTASPALGADAALGSATLGVALSGTNAASVVSGTAFDTLGDLNSPILKGRIARTNVGSAAPGRSTGKASRLPLPHPFRKFDGSYDSIDDILARDAPVRSVAASAGVQGAIDNNIGDLAGVQESIGSMDDTVIRLSLVRQFKAVKTSTPRLKKPSPSYSLFPERAAAPRTPNQTLGTDHKSLVDKPIPDTSSNSAFMDGVYQDNLGLNKPLPAISPSEDSSASSSAYVSTKDVSPNFPGLLGLRRTPAEKEEVARVRRFGSVVKKRLAKFWTKSDEDLVVKQTSAREHRAGNVTRLKALARDMDALTPNREKRRSSPLVDPVLPTAAGADDQTIQTPTQGKRDVSMNAIVAAMGLAGRRKTIGENIRVNGA